MTAQPAHAVHHITLSVSDVPTSVAWYQSLFGPADVVTREGEGWQRTRLTWPDHGDLRIALMAHDGAPAGGFSHLNRGLDHLGFDCASANDVTAWAERIDELGFSRGPLEDVQYGWVVTARDPDGIPIEFFCGK
jgi:catechol 2,3-dioxygenase-like lactoylglutathione lyase family enzyme